MELTKLKDDGASVTVQWRTAKGDDTVTHELSSYDRPHSDLTDAMKDLVPAILKLLELPSGYDENFRVQSISISYQSDNRGAVITCLKGLADTQAPLVLNTPHLPEEPTSEGGPCLPASLVAGIERVEDEALEYVNGKRQQGDLFRAA